ncbi:MAG: hypothetical protein RL187_762 [Actinomycetota bacterium]
MRGLLIVDVQNDFCEGGALGVDGGELVARGITHLLEERASHYGAIIASRDWHDADNDNGGHFAAAGDAPDFVTTWPVHCVAGTTGADYHPGLAQEFITHHVKKGQGVPAYSMFEGLSDDGKTVESILREAGVTEVDVVGIATDHCVRASALDAKRAGFGVTVLKDLVAAVSAETEKDAVNEMNEAGVVLGRA